MLFEESKSRLVILTFAFTFVLSLKDPYNEPSALRITKV